MLLLAWGSSSEMLGQGSAANENQIPAIVLDSMPVEVIRVRSVDTRPPIDSLWREDLWSWDGLCLGKDVTFRFEWSDSIFKLQNFPCELRDPALNEGPLRLEQSNGLTFAPPQRIDVHEASVSFSRFQLESIPGQPYSTSCYPPSSDASIEAIAAEVNNAVFESDKCKMLENWVKDQCLTYEQASLLLRLIPSEDRRLETMKKGFLHLPIWSEESAAELFHLSFLKSQARQSVTSEK